MIVYQHVHAYRVIFTDGRPHYDDGIEFYMGDSRGRWEGNTLVVDVTNFKPETWLDDAGNFHGNKLHVVERYTRTEPTPYVTKRPSRIRRSLNAPGPSASISHATPSRIFSCSNTNANGMRKGVYRHPPQFLK